MRARAVPAVVLTAAALMAVHPPMPAFAAPTAYTVSGPATYENLSVYFVHGASSKTPAPMTLDEATSKGLVRIHESGTGSPTIDNLSNQSLFVQFGDLIRGGLQDQVVSMSRLLGPGATGIPLTVFCVEKGRSIERQGDDKTAFVSAAAMLPSRMAKLSLLSGASQTEVADHVRQIGVWLRIESMRNGLAAQIGGPIESPRSKTSLPLALEHPGVSRAQLPYLNGLQPAGEAGHDVVGAVFAINGSLSSAEIYPSHAFFQKMWPKLLRAYATEAAMTRGMAAVEPPSRTVVTEFVTAADQAAAAKPVTSDHIVRVEDDGGIYAVAQSDKGAWVHKSYLAKGGEEATPIEAAVLAALAANRVDDAEFAAARNTDRAIEQRELVRLLARMTDDRDQAVRQALAAALPAHSLLVAEPTPFLPLSGQMPDSSAFAQSDLRSALEYASRTGVHRDVSIAFAVMVALSASVFLTLAGIVRLARNAGRILAELQAGGRQVATASAVAARALHGVGRTCAAQLTAFLRDALAQVRSTCVTVGRTTRALLLAPLQVSQTRWGAPQSAFVRARSS